MSSDNNIKYFSILLISLTCGLPTEQRQSRKNEGNGLVANFPKLQYNAPEVNDHEHEKNEEDSNSETNCWASFSASTHFTVVDALDQKYATARTSFHKKEASHLSARMLKAMMDSGGVAYRTIHNFADGSKIPAGLHLGGQCMIVMEDSVLFFSRMKMRNNTVFKVNYLENDLMNMTVRTHLSLNDIHLVGAYERAPIHDNPSVLLYVPNAGETEILLKNVNYKVEGRLRLQGNRLVVVTVLSDITVEDVLMTFTNDSSERPTSVQPNDLIDFMNRIKHDLNLWLMDYFNDYYTYFELQDVDSEFRQYEKARILAFNRFADHIVKRIKQRIYELNLMQAEIPKFTLNAIPNVQIQLSNGTIRGLDTIFKKTLATGIRQKDVRHIDMAIGFSNLKVLYRLDVILPNKGPDTSGHLQLTADDLTASLQVSMVQKPETVNLKFNYLRQVKPFALTVEGVANRVLSSYKHLLENHIIILMLNELIVNIKNLGTLTRCNPLFHPDHGLQQQRYIRRHLINFGRRKSNFVNNNKNLTSI